MIYENIKDILKKHKVEDYLDLMRELLTVVYDEKIRTIKEVFDNLEKDRRLK